MQCSGITAQLLRLGITGDAFLFFLSTRRQIKGMSLKYAFYYHNRNSSTELSPACHFYTIMSVHKGSSLGSKGDLLREFLALNFEHSVSRIHNEPVSMVT
jgi:hypothetical protein